MRSRREFAGVPPNFVSFRKAKSPPPSNPADTEENANALRINERRFKDFSRSYNRRWRTAISYPSFRPGWIDARSQLSPICSNTFLTKDGNSPSGCADLNHFLISELFDVAQRWLAEESAVFTIELADAFVSNLKGHG